MARNSVSALAFAASVAAAILAAILVSSSALADGISRVETPRHAQTPSAQEAPAPFRLGEISADDLKQGYLLCERALDSETFTACSVVYQELLRRVFGGNLNAMLAWLREAWHASAEFR
jgi:hypothetical protein